MAGKKVMDPDNVPGTAEFDIIKYLSDYTDGAYEHCMNKYPEREWMFKIQKDVWNGPHLAHKQGKKLVFIGTAFPGELIHAMDAVPLFLDTIGIRLATDPELLNRYIDLAEEVVPHHLCAIDKTVIGMVMSGDIKDKPDLYLYANLPCDSARATYPRIAEIFEEQGIPTLAIDMPYRRDKKGYQYIADQLKESVPFIEKALDRKLDWKRFAATIYRSNLAYDLMKQCSDLRKLKPCPSMSRILVLNSLYHSVAGTQTLIDFFNAEYKELMYNIEHGISAVPEEKHRYTWLQDMPWSNMALMDWMEKKYGAVCVMDTLGYNAVSSLPIDNPWDEDEVWYGLAKRQMQYPMTHASSGPAAPYLDMAEDVVRDWDIDVAMFVGHVGCKHTWACSKMVCDGITERLGVPTFSLDLDALDGRYKSKEEVRAQISEYMDSLDD